MTKSELIEALARKQSHLAYKDVELAVKKLIGTNESGTGHGSANRDSWIW